MKKINKYISMVALSALAMAFNACTDECEREASPVQTDGLTAYIDFNTLTSLEFLPDDEQAFEVKIGRQLATETATVHITAEGEKFNVPQTVEFAAGETEKTVKITFDIAIGTSASVKIGIEESETYIYGLTEQTIKVSRDYTWVSAGSLTFSDATFTGAEEELAVEKAKEGNNLYRIIEPYCEEGAGIHVQFTLDDNNNAVSLLPVGSLFDLGNGYQLYYAPEQYPNYCFFTNEGDSSNFGFLFTDNGSDLYVGSGSFVWNKGYPGK